jgi:hypothetical protein
MDNKQSRKWTEELTSLAHRLGDDSLLLEAQHCRWGDEFYGGNVPQLLETSEDGIRRYDTKRHAQLADAFGGHDPGVCALGILCVVVALGTASAQCGKLGCQLGGNSHDAQAQIPDYVRPSVVNPAPWPRALVPRQRP